MAKETIKVSGITGLKAAFKAADTVSRRELRGDLREAGNLVRDESRSLLGELVPPSPRTAGGFRTVVRTRGVSVEQRIGKTTGTRPDWAATQLFRALEPALDHKREETIILMQHSLKVMAREAGF